MVGASGGAGGMRRFAQVLVTLRKAQITLSDSTRVSYIDLEPRQEEPTQPLRDY